MARKPKPKLTDAERYERFVKLAHDVEADETAKGADKAFTRIAQSNRGTSQKTRAPQKSSDD